MALPWAAGSCLALLGPQKRFSGPCADGPGGIVASPGARAEGARAPDRAWCEGPQLARCRPTIFLWGRAVALCDVWCGFVLRSPPPPLLGGALLG